MLGAKRRGIAVPNQPGLGSSGGSHGQQGGAPLAYHEGYPAYTGGGTQPDVALQWIFDEASGNIVDEVAGVTLTANGSPTYSQTVSGVYAGLSPGITGNSGYFRKAGTTAEGVIGTGDATIEVWYEQAVVSGTKYMFACTDDSDGDKGYSATIRTEAGTESVALWLKATDGTTVTSTWTFNPATSGEPSKMRFVINRATGLATLYHNGASKGDVDISSLAGKTIICEDMEMFGVAGAVLQMVGKLYEWRLSLNATNNSGGPNGG